MSPRGLTGQRERRGNAESPEGAKTTPPTGRVKAGAWACQSLAARLEGALSTGAPDPGRGCCCWHLTGGAVSLTPGVGGVGTPGNRNQFVSAGPRAAVVATGVRKTLLTPPALQPPPAPSSSIFLCAIAEHHGQGGLNPSRVCLAVLETGSLRPGCRQSQVLGEGCLPVVPSHGGRGGGAAQSWTLALFKRKPALMA